MHHSPYRGPASLKSCYRARPRRSYGEKVTRPVRLPNGRGLCDVEGAWTTGPGRRARSQPTRNVSGLTSGSPPAWWITVRPKKKRLSNVRTRVQQAMFPQPGKVRLSDPVRTCINSGESRLVLSDESHSVPLSLCRGGVAQVTSHSTLRVRIAVSRLISESLPWFFFYSVIRARDYFLIHSV